MHGLDCISSLLGIYKCPDIEVTKLYQGIVNPNTWDLEIRTISKAGSQNAEGKKASPLAGKNNHLKKYSGYIFIYSWVTQKLLTS